MPSLRGRYPRALAPLLVLLAIVVATALPAPRSITAQAVTEYAIPTAGSAPQGIVTGPDSALWFTESDAGKIGRVTTGGAITEYTVPTGCPCTALIAAGPDGALWFTD